MHRGILPVNPMSFEDQTPRAFGQMKLVEKVICIFFSQLVENIIISDIFKCFFKCNKVFISVILNVKS